MLPKKLITFYAGEHSYADKFGMKYTSVSSVLNCIKTAFPKEAIARQVAKKRGISTDDLLLEWQKNSQLACAWGHEVHEMLEYFIKDGVMPTGDTMPSKIDIFNGVYKLHRDRYFKTKNLITEQVVFLPEHLIAGTADLICIHEDGITIDIYDYKTGKKMKEKAYNGKKMQPPLNHVEDCKLNQYSLQMSIYGKILETWGYKVNSINVIWFENLEENEMPYWHGTYRTHTIKIPYMKSDVELVLRYRKDKAKNEGTWVNHPRLDEFNKIISEHHKFLLGNFNK